MFRVLVLLAWCIAFPVFAEKRHSCASDDVISGVVEKVGRGNHFSLSGSSVAYILSGIEPNLAPKAGSQVELHTVRDEPDRYGRVPVHAFLSGVWFQGRVLEDGKAYAYALDETGTCLKAMRSQEEMARTSKVGLWANANSEIVASNIALLEQRLGRFVSVKGKILSVGDRRRRIYLNFGQKWSQDFTVSVVKKGAGAFKEKTEGSLRALANLKGKSVRVRGIMEMRQGPLIRLMDEAQIEILD